MRILVWVRNLCVCGLAPAGTVSPQHIAKRPRLMTFAKSASIFTTARPPVGRPGQLGGPP
jgi:hypothetical protein